MPNNPKHPLGTLKSKPPEASPFLFRFSKLARRPLDRFLHIEAASGILLLIAAAIALIWANSPWATTYTQFFQTPLAIRVGTFTFERSLNWFINDGLMVIFFFVVGLEIRREIYQGELSEWRRATLPVAAAFGGMLVPASLYLILAGAPETRSGWGVPMATDIAFAVGILTLLGNRVPAALRVLLLAVAVIDDLGAIIVIALFYSSGIALSGLLVAIAAFVAIIVMQRLGIRSRVVYIIPGCIAWAGVYAAGVHPTIAGVLLGLMTPVVPWLGPEGFLASIQEDLEVLENGAKGTMGSTEMAAALRHVNIARRETLAPADSLIEDLHSWVAFIIMPIFALANAGVSLSGDVFDQKAVTVATAVAVGLLVGKPLGILLFSGTVLKLRLATLPLGITYRHLFVLSVVAGVGFTMALFIAQLAFSNPSFLGAAKLGILGASGAAAVLTLVFGRIFLSETNHPAIAMTADEAESSTEK